MTYQLIEWSPSITQINCQMRPPGRKGKLGRLVMLQLDTKGGEIVLYLDIEQAEAIAKLLKEKVDEARSYDDRRRKADSDKEV